MDDSVPSYQWMKKWLIRIGIFLVVAFVTLMILAKTFLSKDYLVERLEKSINSRVQLGELDVSFNGVTATVTMKKVILTERDDVVESGVKHDERTSLDSGEVEIEELTFELSAWEILSRKIDIESLDARGVKMDVVLYEDGGSSLKRLFSKPKKKGDLTGDSGTEKRETFNAKDNEKFVTQIKNLSITDVDVRVVVEKTQLELKGSDLSFHISDIKVDPNALETVNNAKLKLDGKLAMRSLEKNLDYGYFDMKGEADVTLFNKDSGDAEPDLKLDLALSNDSYFTSRIPLANRLWVIVERLRLSEKVRIPEKITFSENQHIHMQFSDGKIGLIEPIDMHIKDWELTIGENAWFHTGSELHDIGLKVRTGEKVSAKAGGKLDSLLGKISEKVDIPLLSGFKQDWFENGKLTIPVRSRGLLSSPQVTTERKIPDTKDLLDSYLGDDKEEDPLKQAGKNLLKELLK